MDATAFDYFVRDVLRLICSPFGFLGVVMATVSLSAWRRAMEAEGYGVEAWAIDRGLKSHAYVSRQLSGEKGISLKDIEAAPVAVRRWYHLFCLDEIGLPPVTKTAAAVQRRLTERIA